MLQYWTTWNFCWFICNKNGLINYSNALKTSILITSLIGGFMTYIYPRKFLLKINNIKYDVPHDIMIFFDILFHQYPLISYFYFNNSSNKDDKCGKYIFIPFSGWFLYNYLNKNDFDKIYGIKMYKLIWGSFFMVSGYGACHHYFKKNNFLLK